MPVSESLTSIQQRMFNDLSRDALAEGPVIVSHDPDYGWIVEIPVKGFHGKTEYEFASNHLSHVHQMNEDCHFNRRKSDAVDEATEIAKAFGINVEIYPRYRKIARRSRCWLPRSIKRPAGARHSR